MSRHNRRLCTIRGISRASRPAWRHHPQFRLDCSQAIYPFSQSTTGIPRLASVSAAKVPIMPPPMTTTLVAAGITSSEMMESTYGPMNSAGFYLLNSSLPRGASGAWSSNDWRYLSSMGIFYYVGPHVLVGCVDGSLYSSHRYRSAVRHARARARPHRSSDHGGGGHVGFHGGERICAGRAGGTRGPGRSLASVSAAGA